MYTPQNIPLDAIDTQLLPRDRTLICTEAQTELQSSIAQNGLRLPIEVYKTDTGFALISGYRRLLAFQSLHTLTDNDQYAKIPAVIRNPADKQAALAAMVEENEIRQNPSPWERARIAIVTTDTGVFATLDAALAALYPQISRQKRAKLRAVAEVVEGLGGQLIDPELLSENQLIRLSQILRLGWTEIVITTLGEHRDKTCADQWHRLLPVIQEVEKRVSENRSTNPNCPRRLSRPKKGVSIRREKTRNGYILHITGRQANDMLVTEVLEEIERWMGPA
jgi:ParB family transcriptional regulator, chromosome partitioning protein